MSLHQVGGSRRLRGPPQGQLTEASVSQCQSGAWQKAGLALVRVMAMEQGARGQRLHAHGRLECGGAWLWRGAPGRALAVGGADVAPSGGDTGADALTSRTPPASCLCLQPPEPRESSPRGLGGEPQQGKGTDGRDTAGAWLGPCVTFTPRPCSCIVQVRKLPSRPGGPQSLISPVPL